MNTTTNKSVLAQAKSTTEAASDSTAGDANAKAAADAEAARLKAEEEAKAKAKADAETKVAEAADETDPKAVSNLDLASLLPQREDSAEDATKKPLALVKHRSIRSFKVGRFEFANHLLRLYTQEDVEEFSAAYRGLDSIDRNAIVTVDVAAQEASEKGFVPSVTRGALSTSGIKDPKSVN